MNFELPKEQKECLVTLYNFGNEITNLRKRPLLIMFYSKEECSQIDEGDIYELEQKLNEKIPEGVFELDVCIQTLGGDANSSYLIAQLIRNYSNYMEILIPNYSYSGGTLISLASNKIILGKTAKISPIDLQLSYIGEDSPPAFALVNIEKYIDFIVDTCNKFKFKDEENKTKFVTPLIKALVESHGTSDLGELFRMRGLTEFHARILLMDYMFKNETEKRKIVDPIIKLLTSESPTHNFEIDFHIAKRIIGLKVENMDSKIYKLTRQLFSVCENARNFGLICEFVGNERRRPFFEIFLPKEDKKNE